MKWSSLSVLVLALFCAVVRADDTPFTSSLSPEDFHRAGLDKLTADERAALDALVSGKKTVVKEIVRTVTVEAPVAPASDPSPAAVSKRATESSSASEAGGWLNWIKPKPTPVKPKADKSKTAAPEFLIESTLVGKFRGWDKDTIFHLANGQAWVVSDYTSVHFIHSVDNPRVTITSGGIFGYILKMPDNDEVMIRVRAAN